MKLPMIIPMLSHKASSEIFVAVDSLTTDCPHVWRFSLIKEADVQKILVPRIGTYRKRLWNIPFRDAVKSPMDFLIVSSLLHVLDLSMSVLKNDAATKTQTSIVKLFLPPI